MWVFQKYIQRVEEGLLRLELLEMMEHNRIREYINLGWKEGG